MQFLADLKMNSRSLAVTAKGARLTVIIAGFAMVCFFWTASQNQTRSSQRSLPSAEELIQILMRDLEAEEKESGEPDDYVRGQISKALVYLGQDKSAIDSAAGGSGSWRAINLAVVVQTQARLTGHTLSAAELAALGLSEEYAWLLPLSIAEGFLESGRATEAHRALESVPVNRGTMNAVIPQFYRLGQQLQHDGSADGLREVLQQAVTLVEEDSLYPSQELHLALLTRLAMRSHQPDVAERFRRQAIVVSDKHQPKDVPISTPSPIFATLQAALACHEVGDLNESRQRIELAIQQCEQITSGANNPDHDLRERAQTLEKLARRLHEFGHPAETLRCLELSAGNARKLEWAFGRDAGLRDLTVAAHDLNHHELADQFETHIESPSWKLIALRDQVERLRHYGRHDEARKRLLVAEALLPSILELSPRIGEISELGAAWTRLGDSTRGRERFQRALQLSEQDEQSNHQSIARIQIKIGLLNDAFATTQQMTERKYRIIPLVELAVAAATKNFERQRAAKTR